MSPTQILDGLLDNPSSADSHATTAVLNWAWAVFAFIFFTDLVLIGFNMFGKARNPLFHQLAVMILTTSAIAWWAVASNLGKTAVGQEFNSGSTRDFFYARYIQYFVNWPLSVILLLLGTGFPLGSISITVYMAAAFDVCLLVGALVPNAWKWGFYAIGLVCMLYAIWHIFGRVGRSLFPSPSGLSSGGYRGGAGILSLLWVLYAIAWGCSEGGNVISVRSEIIWYGILDVLWAPGWVAFFLVTHRSLTSGTAAVGTGIHGHGAGVDGAGTGAGVGTGLRGEKAAHAGHPVGANTGAATDGVGAGPTGGPAATHTV